MTKFINFRTIFYCIIVLGLTVSSCKDKDDDPAVTDPEVTESDTTVSCNAFAKTIEENPAANLVLGTLEGSTNKGTASFSLLSENPTGAFAIDATSGQLSVNDNSLYTLASNPTLTGTYEVRNGKQTTSCTITITLKDTSSTDLPNCGEDPTYVKIYDGNVQLKSQSDVDTFAASGWTEVTGRLLISGSQITDLSGLRSLTKVDDLSIWRINEAEGLSGLCNLQEIGRVLEIQSCNGLKSLKGLERLKSIGRGLELTSNAVLEDISTLSNLELVGYEDRGETYYENITIETNPKLVDFTGLEGITQTRELRVIDNASITSLKGLGSITKAVNVFIQENDELISLDELKLVAVEKSVSISSNPKLTSANIASLESARSLGISQNNALINVSGYSKLTSLEGLSFYKNTMLSSISGFDNLESIGDGGTVNVLYVNDCQSLTSLTSFTNLKNIKGGFGINECRKLTSINGLVIEEIEGSLTLAYTDLTELSGLGNLTKVGGMVAIRKNPKLTDFCELKPLLSGTGFSGTWSVMDNSANPTTVDVLANCP